EPALTARGLSLVLEDAGSEEVRADAASLRQAVAGLVRAGTALAADAGELALAVERPGAEVGLRLGVRPGRRDTAAARAELDELATTALRMGGELRVDRLTAPREPQWLLRLGIVPASQEAAV
ncbi:MAG: hypothetical protein MJE66_10550, partial [Proteobacteria bacterium]|nr:hypothetical protein [Pseudomonadota bacterium]